jgi:hypothetical protein
LGYRAEIFTGSVPHEDYSLLKISAPMDVHKWEIQSEEALLSKIKTLKTQVREMQDQV